MTELTQREYLRKLAPDFSVLEMLEQAYYQGQTNNLTDLGKGIFYYPDNTSVNKHHSPVLYRAMFLFDEAEGTNTKYFTNSENFIYEVYNYGDRYVTIAVLIDRLFKEDEADSLPKSGIEVNTTYFLNVFGVGF